ncbi:hypothetical protein A2U01_0114960, partial [Trifolium medium]|nr:hypothetical protein [Trifolium medium]
AGWTKMDGKIDLSSSGTPGIQFQRLITNFIGDKTVDVGIKEVVE